MSTRNPSWTSDELIVALDFYLRHRSFTPGKKSQEIQELSDALNSLPIHRKRERDERFFRNVNGVYMKLMNFRRLDPAYTGKGLERGGKEEEHIWKRFASDPKHCTKAATAILATADEQAEIADEPSSHALYIEEAEEGRLLTRQHIVRERNRKLVERRKELFMSEHGQLYCEACGFDFEAVYGKRGQGFIECHHVRPLHTLRQGQRTKLADLALVCSNCHRMIHAHRPWLSMDELRAILRGK